MELLLERLVSPLEAALPLLSAEELERASRLRRPLHLQRFVLAHAFLRRKLGERLGQPPASLSFDHGPEGKPLLAGLYFNLSHSGDLAALVLSTRHPVGVDIEAIQPVDALGLARDHFAPSEAALIADACHPVAAFFRLWTRKEAVLKAHGLGIGHSLAELPRAWVRDFTPAVGYAGAVAWLDRSPMLGLAGRPRATRGV
jgi:4'-phosphopantetheinyl transferase